MGQLIPFPKRPPSVLTGLERAVRGKLDDWKMTTDKDAESFASLEEQLEELFRSAHREAIGEALAAAADVDASAVVYEGRECRRVLVSSKEYMTSAGPVTVRRALFRDRTTSTPAFASLDKRVGVVDGFWTPRAARNALWMVTQMVPAKAAEALGRLTPMTPSKSTLQRLPTSVSSRWEEGRAEFEQSLIAAQEIPQGTFTLAVSLDGVYAPIDGEESHVEKREAKHAKGEAARGPDAYREIGCASIAFYSAECELLGAIRFGRAPEFKKLGVKEMLAAELRGLVERNPEIRNTVFLSDGAPDHWEFFDSLPFEGVQVLDFFHAAEHLNAALSAAYGEGSVKARRRFAELRHVLLEEPGGAATVHRSLKRLAKLPERSNNQQRLLDRAVRYFAKHADRMHYAECSESQLPIGSGVMEASCKTLVAQRLKLSGQRWSVPGAQAILTPRGWDQSDRFDAAFALLAATYARPITVLSPISSASG